jgi:hypothetical protein
MSGHFSPSSSTIRFWELGTATFYKTFAPRNDRLAEHEKHPAKNITEEMWNQEIIFASRQFLLTFAHYFTGGDNPWPKRKSSSVHEPCPW